MRGDIAEKVKCDYGQCTEWATTKGHIFGHVRDSGEKDTFLPVMACDKHKLLDSFFEDYKIT